MCTEPGSEQTVRQVENLIVVKHTLQSMMGNLERDSNKLIAWAMLLYLGSQVRFALTICMFFWRHLSDLFFLVDGWGGSGGLKWFGWKFSQWMEFFLYKLCVMGH